MPDYELLAEQARALLDGERDFIANAANFASLLFHELDRVNWVGFYLLSEDGELVLGPFNGRPATPRLAKGRGVCGRAVTTRETIVVDDVHQFDDHVACDTASRSEIVIPLREDDAIFGVLDVDSPESARFGETDRVGIERLAAAFVEAVKGNQYTRERRAR